MHVKHTHLNALAYSAARYPFTGLYVTMYNFSDPGGCVRARRSGST